MWRICATCFCKLKHFSYFFANTSNWFNFQLQFFCLALWSRWIVQKHQFGVHECIQNERRNDWHFGVICDHWVNGFYIAKLKSMLDKELTIYPKKILKNWFHRVPVSRTGYLNVFPRISRHPLRKDIPYVEITNSGDITVGTNPTNEEYNLWRSIDRRVQRMIKMGCSGVNMPEKLFNVRWIVNNTEYTALYFFFVF